MMIDYEQLVSEMQARAEEAEAALKLATEERDVAKRTLDNICATFMPVRDYDREEENDSGFTEEFPYRLIQPLFAAIPEKSGDQPRVEHLCSLYKQERDDLSAPAHQLWEQNAAIANLTPEAVIAAEAKLDAVFGSVFQAEDPPMLDYARLKMELRRLRLAHIAARKVIGELTDHLKEYDNEHLSDWWNKSVDGLLSHKLVSAHKEGAQG